MMNVGPIGKWLVLLDIKMKCSQPTLMNCSIMSQTSSRLVSCLSLYGTVVDTGTSFDFASANESSPGLI
jgi:hypothetical protein